MATSRPDPHDDCASTGGRTQALVGYSNISLADPLVATILDNGQVKLGNQDPQAYRQRLEAKLRPE